MTNSFQSWRSPPQTVPRAFSCFSVLFRAIPCYSVRFRAIPCDSVLFRDFPWFSVARGCTKNHGVGHIYILVFIFMTICASSPYLTSFSITLAGFSEDPSQKLNRTSFMTSFFCDIYLVKSCSYTYSTHFIIDAPKRLQKFIVQKLLSLGMFCDVPCFSVLFRAFPCKFRAIPC